MHSGRRSGLYNRVFFCSETAALLGRLFWRSLAGANAEFPDGSACVFTCFFISVCGMLKANDG